MGTAAIYTRISVRADQQRTKALKRQESACRKAAKKAGDRVIKSYRDVAPAATEADRPGLRRFMDHLQDGENVDRLYVLGLDRLGRDSGKALTKFMKEMAKLGVEVRGVPARPRKSTRTGHVRSRR